MSARFSLVAALILSLSLTSFAQDYYSTTEEPYPTSTEEPAPEPTPPDNGCWEDTVPFCCPDCLKWGPYTPCENPVFVGHLYNCTVDLYPEGWACCGDWVNGSTSASSWSCYPSFNFTGPDANTPKFRASRPPRPVSLPGSPVFGNAWGRRQG